MPDGVNGLSIDDDLFGAPDVSLRLYNFLKTQNQKISQFVIRANIRDCPQVFPSRIPKLKDDNIGGHTWPHPYKPNADGAIIEVPSHPGLSFVIAILSVVGGMLL